MLVKSEYQSGHVQSGYWVNTSPQATAKYFLSRKSIIAETHKIGIASRWVSTRTRSHNVEIARLGFRHVDANAIEAIAEPEAVIHPGK